MSFSCAIQFVGLVRNDNPKGKHRANGKAIVGEQGKERISKSETLDRSRTASNRYDQSEKSGFAVWTDMEKRADEYKQEVKGKTKTGEPITRYKGLRHDAVIGVACIINPPYEACKDWTAERYRKFYSDTQEIMAEIKPELFRSSNQVFGVEHRDEGVEHNDFHKHLVYDAIDDNGRYCGNKLDSKFLVDFNKAYPSAMRKRGWDMADYDLTDWNKYKTDDEYKRKRKRKAKSQGKAVNDYIRDKAKESVQQAEQIISDTLQQAEALEAKQAELDEREAELDKREAEISEREADIEAERKVVSGLQAVSEKANAKAKERLREAELLKADYKRKLEQLEQCLERLDEMAESLSFDGQMAFLKGYYAGDGRSMYDLYLEQFVEKPKQAVKEVKKSTRREIDLSGIDFGTDTDREYY